MSTFKERLDERMLSLVLDHDGDDTVDLAFMAGARAALLLAADESEALSERMIAWDGALRWRRAAAQHLMNAQRLRDRAKEIE